MGGCGQWSWSVTVSGPPVLVTVAVTETFLGFAPPNSDLLLWSWPCPVRQTFGCSASKHTVLVAMPTCPPSWEELGLLWDARTAQFH